MKIGKLQISDGCKFPPFYYGYSYRDYPCELHYYYIIPLNYIVRWIKVIPIFWNRFRSKESYMDKIIKKEHRIALKEIREFRALRRILEKIIEEQW